MLKLSRLFREYSDAGAFSSLIAIEAVIDERTYITKGGHLLTALQIRGLDDECLDPAQRDQIVRRIQAAVGLLGSDFRLYQFMIKTDAGAARRGCSKLPIAQVVFDARATQLESAGLCRIELYWVVVYEGWTARSNGGHRAWSRPLSLSTTAFQGSLSAQIDRSRQLLEHRVSAMTMQLRDIALLKPLDKGESFRLFRRLVNYAPHKVTRAALVRDFSVDFQICNSALECYRDHLELDNFYVQVLTLKEPPAHTLAHMFRDLAKLPCHFIVATEWKQEPDAAARRLIQTKRRHFHNSKASLLNYLGQQTDSKDILIDEGAAAVVRDLGGAQAELEQGRHFGQFSLTVILYAEDPNAVRRGAAECYKVFATFGAELTDERYNLLNAFVATIPGNSDFNLRRIWLSDVNAADLALVCAPDPGNVRNEYLGADCLATLETRQATPYHLNLHCQDVGHTLVLGATGSGKSFTLNFLVTQLQKYEPFTFIFDLGGSYQTLTKALGGAHRRVAHEANGFSINPFVLPPTKENLQFLFSFVRVLAESNDYRMDGEAERDLYEQLENLYALEIEQRRLGTLAGIVNRRLGSALGRWVGSGQYGRVFDNSEDNLTLADFQAFDFEGMDKVPDLLEPLLFYVLHRASAVVNDPANATRLKAIILDEGWRFLIHPVIRLYVLEALKTFRKRNALVILATQSGEDLLRSEMLGPVLESCPTRVFLANPGADIEAYRRTFHLNAAEADLIRELLPKRELLLTQPKLSKVLRLNVDPREYWLYTSDPYEARRRDNMVARYGLREGLERLTKEAK